MTNVQRRHPDLRSAAELKLAKSGRRSCPTTACFPSWVLAHLLGTYVGLSIAYDRGGQVLASSSRLALDDDVRALEVTRLSSNPQVRALADQRAAIARRRAERWDRSRATLDGITQQLAMIGELVQLTHEQVLAPVDPRDATFEVGRILSQLADSQSVVDELAEVLVEGDIEPRMLDMGKAAMI